MPICNELITGNDVKEALYEMASLRIDIFREYPYLYKGNRKEELHYLRRYAEVKCACAILVMDDENIVGVATGIPLRHEKELLGAFACSHYSIDETYYVGELLLDPAYRNLGLGIGMMAMMEEYVCSLGSYHNIVCTTVVLPDEHSLRPQEYVPIDRFLFRSGFLLLAEITTFFKWCEIDGVCSEHLMNFWVKKLK